MEGLFGDLIRGFFGVLNIETVHGNFFMFFYHKIDDCIESFVCFFFFTPSLILQAIRARVFIKFCNLPNRDHPNENNYGRLQRDV